MDPKKDGLILGKNVFGETVCFMDVYGRWFRRSFIFWWKWVADA